MHESKQIKIVIIMHSELAQRWLDYFCLDTLNEEFDLEYWDCSDFVLPGFHFDKKIERDYVRKIHSNFDLWSHLFRLPKDTLISNDVHFNKSNYLFHKILSHYFPKINYINFYSNFPDKSNPDGIYKPIRTREPYHIGGIKIVKRLKGYLYQNKYIKLAIEYATHWNNAYRDILLTKFTDDEFSKMYEKYEISCVVGAKYHINHPDVEAYCHYIKQDAGKNDRGNQYMVYIDQFFPFHPDIKEHFPNLNVEQLAHDFYASLNKYFERVEKKYQCRVIIAAHPLSNFQSNLFNGREMVLNRTVQLVGGSIGVLMHSSNALSYAMLFHKPILMLVNGQTEQIDFFNNPIVNTSKRFNIPMAYMDDVKDVDIHVLTDEAYKKYISTYFGEIEPDMITPNQVLLKKYLKQVWGDMYNKKDNSK